MRFTRRRMFQLAAVVVIAAAFLSAVMLVRNEDNSREDRALPVEQAQYGVNRNEHRPTVEGADTLLKFRMRLDGPEGRTSSGLLACKGASALSGSSGRVFSSPEQAHRACRSVQKLKAGVHRCPVANAKLPSAPSVKIDGVRFGLPFEAEYELGACESARKAWERAKAVWMWPSAPQYRTVIPVPAGRNTPDVKAWDAAAVGMCDVSLIKQPLHPCLEKIDPGESTQTRMVQFDETQIQRLRSGEDGVVQDVLAAAKPVSSGRPVVKGAPTAGRPDAGDPQTPRFVPGAKKFTGRQRKPAGPPKLDPPPKPRAGKVTAPPPPRPPKTK